MASELHLNVLLFQEHGHWVAQVLEKDMAAHGDDPYAALAAIGLVIQSHVNFDTRYQLPPLSRLARAPQVYWDAMTTARPLPHPEVTQWMPPAVINALITNDPVSVADC